MDKPHRIFYAMTAAATLCAAVPPALLYDQAQPTPINCPTTTILRSTDVIVSKLQEAHHASPENCLAVYDWLAANDTCMEQEPDRLNQQLWKKSWKDYQQICRHYPML